ncbi:uncharacterized protein LOC127854649 [Dreissena polymorpha]|uniref:uncharacterized protein LOC127854647 n=1 Tax=Dreissena polymorpha TaxID=45954 RepID=UPI00226543A6|nr:uncharacterized protein LOC127854647 [Dreissena polymorpha]XP_052245672.1 uncharacterized protein LOC127854649 [Dreissena polymorpha]
MSSDDRRTLLERAQLAEEAGRWEDMVSHIRAIVVTGQELTVEERNLFANAYKNHVGNKRAAWRILESHEIACDMAKDAVSAGVNELNIQPEEARKDSALLLELLKDNIKIWSAEVDSEQQLHRATVRSNFR